ncbi:acyltransferase family protein [Nocardiopsis gilva]|nr:acyltransferase [Nocardiopsis gilva]
MSGDAVAPTPPQGPSSGGPMRRLRDAAVRLDRATPPTRERAIDGLRATAISGIVLGHWMVAALVVWQDGGLRGSSPLPALPWIGPIGWGVQLLALFFLVGGYVAARSRGSADYPAWLTARVYRLGRPVVLVMALWGVLVGVLPLLGVPQVTVRTGAVLVLQPLWFIGVFLVITALTKVLLAADRRFGAAAALIPLAVVGLIDLARFGPWGAAVPVGIGYVNAIPAWMFAFQLGISWAHGRLRRPLAVALLIVGAVGLLVLVTRLGYPAAPIGYPGAERSNLNPPSLFVPVLAMAQIGVAVLLRDRLDRLLRRPLPWAGIAVLNMNALTVFCWHLTALFVVSAVGAAVWGVVPGLTSVPDSGGWLLARVPWILLFAVVLAPLSAALHRFERPWSGTLLGSWPVRAAVGAAATGYAGAMIILL